MASDPTNPTTPATPPNGALSYREIAPSVYLSERWCDPYRTVHGTEWCYAVILVAAHKLTTRQALASCAPAVLAASLAELAAVCDRHDGLALLVGEYERGEVEQ